MPRSTAYKKTYKPFILWLLLFIGLSFSSIPIAQSLFHLDAAATTRVSLLNTLLPLVLLFVVILRGEYVYWINGGPSFEAAREAGSEARRAYARAHLRLFAGASGAGALCIAVFAFLRLSIWLDIAAVCAALVAAALLSLRIKFEG